jgi:hypothetical protein
MKYDDIPKYLDDLFRLPRRAKRRRIRWALILAAASLKGQLVEGEFSDAAGTTYWTGVLHR